MRTNYSYTKILSSSDCSGNLNMRIDSIFKAFQDITTIHSYELGINGNSILKSSNALWVISKTLIKINFLPKENDEVTFKTFITTPTLVRFFREYEILVNNKVAISGVSEWCLIDQNTRKLLPSKSIKYPENLPLNSIAFKAFTKKIPIENTATFKYEHTVRFTDIDFNEHTNNVSYVKMVLDALTESEYYNVNFKEIEFHYLNETKYLDKVSIYEQKNGNNLIYFGKSNNEIIFSALIKN